MNRRYGEVFSGHEDLQGGRSNVGRRDQIGRPQNKRTRCGTTTARVRFDRRRGGHGPKRSGVGPTSVRSHGDQTPAKR